MDEKRFVELMEINNQKLINLFNQRFEEIDKKFEQIDKRFEQIDKRFEQIDKRFEQIDQRFEEIDEKFEQIDKRFDEMDEKIMHNNFYFEENYGRKINAIFDKLQLDDQKRSIENEELEKYKEHNDALLISHDIRITNLEKAVNSR